MCHTEAAAYPQTLLVHNKYNIFPLFLEFEVI